MTDKSLDIFNLLIDQYKIIHSECKYGSTGNLKAQWIIPYINFKCNSLLDYGCGKSILYSTFGLKDVARYDPAIPEFSIKPKRTFDLVTCTGVLEHIHTDTLDWVLQDVLRYSNRVFFTISTRIAGKILPDGRNAHVTIKNTEWWRKKIKEYFDVSLVSLESKQGCHIRTWV